MPSRNDAVSASTSTGTERSTFTTARSTAERPGRAVTAAEHTAAIGSASAAPRNVPATDICTVCHSGASTLAA